MHKTIFKTNPKLIKTQYYGYEPKKKNKIYLDLNETIIKHPHEIFTKPINTLLTDSCYYPRNGDLDKSLLNKIAQYVHVEDPYNRIIVTNGSDNALRYIFNTFSFEGTKTLVLTPTYAQIYNLLGMSGGEVINIPVDNNIKNIIETLDISIKVHKANVVYLCNPNNPLGYIISRDMLKAIIQKHATTMFIIDEAYIEYVDTNESVSSEPEENLIVTRTFSKAFGMAGMRLGYLIASPNIKNIIEKQTNQKDVLDVTKQMGLACLNNIETYKDHFQLINNVRKETRMALQKLIRENPHGGIKKLHVDQGMFMILYCNDATHFANYMDKEHDIIVREKDNGMVRCQIGSRDIMIKFVKACTEYQERITKVDTFLIDFDETISVSNKISSKTVDILNKLNQTKRVFIMTNNSRLILPDSLQNFKLIKPLDYLTDYLKMTNIHKIYFVGNSNDIKNLDVHIIKDVVNDDCQAIVFYDIFSIALDIHMTDDLSYLINTRRVPVICIEDDTMCNTSTIKQFKGNSTKVPDVGSFIKMFTHNYKVIGKPNVILTNLIPNYDPLKTCIIGDNPLTDIQQAKNSGCSSILVTETSPFENLDL